ncbi:hypothetical protein CDAR_36821 [Caerostris darwini]|uniref:Autophagy-related protein n=1 Tax=Caerostris darwini TaxID=1538125 RepID=A0AAV4UVI8_9ARAC|nr:hypothetical protein CDAR_36821 [Caerostris darwini]
MEARYVLEKYNRIPVIVTPGRHLRNTHPDLSFERFMLPVELQVYQLLNILRRRLEMGNHEALFVYIKQTIPTPSQTMLELYNDFQSEDGYLYFTFSPEEVFGSVSR